MGEPAPPQYVEWKMAERFGWTLDYIQSLSMQDFEDYFQILDGETNARDGK